MFTKWFTAYFKPTVEIYYLEKKIPFKMLQFIDNAPGHPNLILKKKNASSKAIIAAIKSDFYSSDGHGQSKLKTFWKEFIFLDVLKIICNSREEIKISTLTGV